MTKLHRASFNFKGSIAVITGAARGQGLSHAAAFAQAGATVIGLDFGRNENHPELQYPPTSSEEFSKATALFSSFGSGNRLIEVDITDTQRLQDVRDELRKSVNNVDFIINNAGVNVVKTLDETKHDEISHVLDVNLFGAINVTKYFSPLIDPRSNGSIIFTSSLAAQRTGSKQSVYAASKAALEGLTRALAVELGVRNIRVNCVAPTLVITPQTIGLASSSPIDYIKAMSSYALPNFEGLQPSDVSDVILFLCSDAARSITGSSIALDCGRLAKA